MGSVLLCTRCSMLSRRCCRHHRKAHGRPLDKLAGQVDRDKFGIGGDPTCRYCQQEFTTWPNLIKHIQDRSCSAHWHHMQQVLPCPSFKQPQEEGVLDTNMSQAGLYPQSSSPADASLLQNQAIAHSETLRAYLARHGWPAVVEKAESCATLTNHCSLCHQWIANPLHMKTHIQRVHRGVWEQYGHSVDKECKLLSSGMRDPCQYCHATQHQPAQHASRCTVTWQACLLKHVWDLRDIPGQFDWQGPPKPESQRTAQRRHNRRARINYEISKATGLPLRKTMPRNFFSRTLEGPKGEQSGLRIASEQHSSQVGETCREVTSEQQQCFHLPGHDDIGVGIQGNTRNVWEHAAISSLEHGGEPSDKQWRQEKSGNSNAAKQKTEGSWQRTQQKQRDSIRRRSRPDHERCAPDAIEARPGHKSHQHGYHNPLHVHEQAEPSGKHTPGALPSQPCMEGKDGHRAQAQPFPESDDSAMSHGGVGGQNPGSHAGPAKDRAVQKTGMVNVGGTLDNTGLAAINPCERVQYTGFRQTDR